MKLRNFIKKSISVLSAVLMLSVVCISPAAQAKSAKETPVIVVPGVTNTPLYRNGEQVFWPEFSQDDFQDIYALAQGLLKLPDTGAYGALADKLIDKCYSLFDGAACKADGTSKYPVKAVTYSTGPISQHMELLNFGAEGNVARAVADKIGYNNVYYYTYDWRVDKVDLVKNNFRPYVEMVKRETGADKVSIVFSSMGGTIASVYLAEYGTLGDTQNVVFSSSAADGVSLFNDLIAGNVKVPRQSLVKYIAGINPQGNTELYALLVSLCSTYAVNIANKLIDSQYDKVFREFIVTVFGYMPGMWYLAEGYNIEECISKAFDPAKSANLISVIRRYFKYQDKLPDTIKAARAAGVNVRVIGGYGIIGTPLVPSSGKLQTDSLIDSKHTTLGATFSDLEDTLGDNYTQKVKLDDDYDHISADKMVDASTCLLPSETWIIKGQWHVDYSSKSKKDFITWLTTTNEPITVASNADYPQFLCVKNGELVTLESTIFVPAETPGEAGMCTNSKPTVYTYTELTLLGWICYVALPIAIIIALIVLASRKGKKKDILAGCEIEGLQEITDDMPKKEKKAAQKANKKVLNKYWKANKTHLIAQYKFCNDKLAPYAVPGIVEIKDDMSKKEIKQAEKTNKKARKAYYKENKKDLKKDFKANKKQKKIDKKEAKKQAKADKKAAKASKK